MRVGIHEAFYGKHGHTRFRIYKEILAFNGIEAVDLDISQQEFWTQIRQCDLFLYRWSHTDRHMQIAHAILPVIENHLKIKCFPDQNTCWHFDDKIRQYFLLNLHGFPYAKCHIFYNRQEALKWTETTGFPVIFKLKTGAGSSNVIKVNTPKKARFLVRKMFSRGIKNARIPSGGNVRFHDLKTFAKRIGGSFKYRYLLHQPPDKWNRDRGYVLFQEFLPGNEFDTRVTTIGRRAFAFIRYNRKNDFRSSGSGLIDHNPNKINLDFVNLAFEISEKLGFQTMAYDFLYGKEGQPEICEISYHYDDKAIWKCHGYWDENLEWHEGHFWPQYFHMMDALDKPELKQPEINA